MSDKVWQEFYCRHCPADDPNSSDPEKRKTGGHFRVKLSIGYDASITLHCPKCKHTHTRHVLKGVILDGSGPSELYKEELKVPKSAWSREPISKLMDEARRKKPNDHHQEQLRKGAVIEGASDLSDATVARDAYMRERWLELYSGGGE